LGCSRRWRLAAVQRGSPTKRWLTVVRLTSTSVLCLVVPAVMISGCSDRPTAQPDHRSAGVQLTSPSVTASPTSKIDRRGRLQWTNMHSDHRPRGPITYGRGDVDGDGHRDLVIVDSRGHLAIADVADRHLWVRIAADASTRLQSVPDLFGDGRHEIVVGSSTAGCCDYRSVASQALVLRYHAGRLAHLRTPDGRVFELSFSLGRGGVFAGVRCRGERLSQRTVTRLGRHRLKVATVRYRVNGTVVVQVHRTTYVQRGSWSQATALSRSACPGMNQYGWAH
jgi:hypothetical protein